MKTYSNRFASMEQQSDGKWVVYSEVSGLPVFVDGSADLPEIKEFLDYNSARSAMLELTEHYKSVSRGGHPL